MPWTLMLVHALNPFLIIVGLGKNLEREKREVAGPRDIAATMFMSVFLYGTLWFLPHWGIVKSFGRDFHPEVFLGRGESISYFFPYAVGGYYLINKTCIEPLLKRPRLTQINSAVNSLALVCSAYVLFVFYVKWLHQ